MTWTRLAAAVYAQGHLRTYALFLGRIRTLWSRC